jgi:hypothetical protein
VILISVLINHSVLYNEMVVEAEKESALLLRQEMARLDDEAIQLSRAYLQAHPDDDETLRMLMYILVNKADAEIDGKELTPEAKQTLLANLLEMVKLAQSKGYPGSDILISKSKIIMLYRVLKRYDKAFSTADDMIKECKSLGISLLEGEGYSQRYKIHWDLKHYREAIADVYLAEEAYLAAKNYSGLIELCEEMAEALHALSPLERYKYRKERAQFEAKAKAYRQKAKEAGQEVPGAKP